MGAAAGKQFQNEKGKHAAAILSAVQSFDETHGVSDVENNPELFKRRVLLAAADAKKNGKDIENSLAQLTDADFETLCQYVGNQKDNSAFANKSASMKIEEIIDDEVANAAADNIDETTSVLSYGDDEEEAVEHESEVETSMNSNTLAARRLKPHNSRQSNISREDDNDSSGDELSIAEIPIVHKKDSAASANGGYKVFPLSAAQSVDSPVGSGKYRKQPRSAELVAKEEQQLMEQDEALLPSSKFRTPTQHQRAKDTPTKHSSHHASAGTPSSLLMPGMLPAGVAEKYSRIWDLDGSDLVASSLSSQHGFDSPAAKQYSSPIVHRKGPSPSGFGATSSHQKAGRQTTSTGGDGKTLLYKDMGERIDERNEALMGLQRKKVISYTQNAQLEREVEALQRQLEKMEQLDRETGSKLAGSSPSTIYGHSNANLSRISSPLHLVLSPPGAVHHRVNLHDSHQSSRPAPGSAGGSRFSSIYPIDEESPQSRHGSGNRAVHNDSRTNNVHSEFKHSGYTGGESKGHRHQPRQHHKHGSSSSSDTDNSSAQHSHPVDMQRAADDKRPARFGRFSEEKEQEETGSTVHKSNISPLHAQQQQPRHVPRRRVRTGLGALGAHGVSGNSSGVESDDSASFQPHRHIRSVQSKPPASDPHEVVTNNEKAEWNSATTVEQPRDREKQQHSVARRERARTNSNFESESASKHTGAAVPTRSGIPGPSRIYGALSEDEFEAAAPPSHAKQLRSGAGHHRGRRMTSEETSPSKLNSVAVEASSNPIEEGYSSGNAGKSGQTRGGALRKLNKRRHSLDGKDDPQLHLHLHQEDGGGAAEDEEVALPIKESSVLQQRAAGRPRRLGTGAVIHPSEPDSSKVTVSPATSLKVHQQRGRHVDGAERTERVEKVEKVEYSPSASKETKETAKEAGSSEHIVNGAQATVAKKRRNRVTSLSGNKPQVAAAVQDATAQDSDGPPPLWTPALDNSWAEVSLLLRKPIKTEQDMLYSVAAAEAGIIFTDQMNIICKSINVLRGALSRWLLPFDNNTRIDSQCSTPHSVVENMPEEFRGKLTERQVHYLVAGANGVRRLVRIKIADDNDLEQARTALITADSFFKALYRAAESAGMSPFQLLQANL